MNKMKKLGKIILISILLIYTASAKTDIVFDIFGLRSYVILSGSMEPKYSPGDVVMVLNKNKTKLNVNDVITFKIKDDIITHRIVEERNGEFITKGDNNNINDADMVKYDYVIGKVIFSIPKVGYIINFISQPLVISIIMILLGLIILIRNTSK